MAYSNSSLATVKIYSPNHSGLRNHSIDTITIHCMAGQMSAESCGNLFSSSSVEASSNYGVGPDGKIGLYVEEKNRSWCSSNSANDNRAVTIEVASNSYHPYAVTDAAYNATIKLVADICLRNGIRKLVWSTNQNQRMNHLNGCNMTVHRDYANKACPGDYLYERMGDIARKANAIISTGKVSGGTSLYTNNKRAWDFLITTGGMSKESAASCIGYWLGENGHQYGVSYTNVTPPFTPGSKSPYKYLNLELFPGEIEGYLGNCSGTFPGNKVIMRNPPDSLISYTYNYRPNGYSYDGYCGIGIGSWTFKYGAGALIKYAKEKGKAWDDLDLQLNFAIAAYSGSYGPYGSIGNPSQWAKRGQSHGCTENNFWPGIDWFVAWEMPAWSGYVSASNPHGLGEYEKLARAVYKEFKDTEIGSYGTNSMGGGVVADPNDVINAEAINALIIAIDPTVKPKDIDYDKMTSNHVSGVMFKAGAFFDVEHKVYTFSRNENLAAQVQSAIDAGVRFGLFFDVRARNVEEAKKECEQLYYTVSKYPPALGLWLHIMFAETDKKKNNKIMDYYVKEMNRWGLFFGCGLYCTKSELDRIDWDKYQENFYLWYINKFTSDSQLDELNRVLSPEFFVL